MTSPRALSVSSLVDNQADLLTPATFLIYVRRKSVGGDHG